MTHALSAAESSMQNAVHRMHAISHNLANVSTPGYKKEVLLERPFGMQFSAALAQLDRTQAQPVIDQGAGMLKFTGNPLDVAVEGDGFFEVMTPQGPAYTRQGNFRVGVDGRLVTTGGMPVMGVGGEVHLDGQDTVIDQGGRIWQQGKLVDQLRVIQFAEPGTLQRLSAGLYASGGAAVESEVSKSTVRQGYLEAANVVMMDEMVRMIETMRQFESSQRVIQGYDTMMEKAINVIGDL